MVVYVCEREGERERQRERESLFFSEGANSKEKTHTSTVLDFCSQT